MLQLARNRAAGAYPLLVTPDYTAQARLLLAGTPRWWSASSSSSSPTPSRPGRVRAGRLG
jgi:hypothetical protein